MTAFLSRVRGGGTHQTRPEGGVSAPPLGPARPVGQWGFTGVAVTSLGGPLALAALYAPSIAAGASSSAGLAMVAAAVAFGFPLAIWLGYARHVSSSGGLYSFTEAAAGHRVALVQAGLWALSYLLYIVYTTAQIVYALAVRAVAQPARHLRRLPEVRRPARRPHAAGLGAGSRINCPRCLRTVDDDPDHVRLTHSRGGRLQGHRRHRAAFLVQAIARIVFAVAIMRSGGRCCWRRHRGRARDRRRPAARRAHRAVRVHRELARSLRGAVPRRRGRSSRPAGLLRCNASKWVLTTVPRDSFHEGRPSCSRNHLYLEPRYGIEP
jgi:hypothetical protein